MSPLTTSQRVAVDALVAARRIEPIVADAERAAAFLSGAAERLSQLPLLTSIAVRYDIAYDAADAALAKEVATVLHRSVTERLV